MIIDSCNIWIEHYGIQPASIGEVFQKKFYCTLRKAFVAYPAEISALPVNPEVTGSIEHSDCRMMRVGIVQAPGCKIVIL